MDELEPMLKRLRLTGMFEQLDKLLEEAARHKMTLREALPCLCAAEVSQKDRSRFEMAMRMACAAPACARWRGLSLRRSPTSIRACSGTWRAAAGSQITTFWYCWALLVWAALGREAIRLGHSMLFCTAAELIANLKRTLQQFELARAFRTYGRPRLLIIDELGYLPLEHQDAYLLIQ